MIIDIHTHNCLAQNAIISTDPQAFNPLIGAYYSVGIHPWNTTSINPKDILLLDEIVAHPAVVAIGETGIDNLKGGSREDQIELFKHHINLSEKLSKPLIIHSVKSHEDIIRIKKLLNPTQKWIIHGFRSNANIALQLIEAGISLSFGEKFNADALRIVPMTSIFVETDESILPINDIYAKIASEIKCNVTQFNDAIYSNIARIFALGV